MLPSRLPPAPTAARTVHHASAGSPQGPAGRLQTMRRNPLRTCSQVACLIPLFFVAFALLESLTILRSLPAKSMKRHLAAVRAACMCCRTCARLEPSQDCAASPEPAPLLQAAQRGHPGPLQRLQRERLPLHRRAEVGDAHLCRHAPARPSGEGITQDAGCTMTCQFCKHGSLPVRCQTSWVLSSLSASMVLRLT